jgi:hypothetical protein
MCIGGLPSLARPARLRKYPLGTVALSHPLAVQLTPEQMAWLDARRVAGLSRSAVLRLVVEQAMRLDKQGLLPATGRREQP